VHDPAGTPADDNSCLCQASAFVSVGRHSETLPLALELLLISHGIRWSLRKGTRRGTRDAGRDGALPAPLPLLLLLLLLLRPDSLSSGSMANISCMNFLPACVQHTACG
jgi:hypothetical protein